MDGDVLRVLWLCIVLCVVASPASSTEVAVIAHPSVPVQKITKTQLLDLYTGDVKEWGNGEPIVLVDLEPKTDVKRVFYDFLGKSTSRMKSIWMKNMLTGEGRPPESMNSQEELLKKVAATPGAIGYVDQSLVTGEVITLTVIPLGND
jgi:ABC-type phosphate transport system substrate-binding protein